MRRHLAGSVTPAQPVDRSASTLLSRPRLAPVPRTTESSSVPGHITEGEGVSLRTIRTLTASILGVGLLAGSAAGVAAQDDRATTEPSTPAIVAGSMLGVGEPVQEPVDTVVDGVSQGRGSVIAGDRFEADDPRLAGSASQTVNGDLRMIGDTAAFLISPSIRIENAEGAWSGQCDLLVIADGSPDPFACLFSGEGAYDGLSAYLVFENPEQPPNPFKGLIFEGGLPPTPELPPTE